MKISSASRTLHTFLCVVSLSCCVSLTTGCYQRTISPELTYDQSQVDSLDQEIKKLDWEE